MKKAGLFIDCENASPKLMFNFLKNRNDIGEFLVKKGFSAGFKDTHKKWENFKSVELKNCLKVGAAKKNTTDLTMSVECINDVYLLNLEIVVLVTSDSDFIPLINLLTSLEKKVIIVGNFHKYSEYINMKHVELVEI